ncbi:SprT family protein [Streptococcus sp. E17BB]|uniref:SprT family protein n=1 Tax=Streptococcus sp. E17BB TaxID=3278714 RepID=UPI00359CC653
MNLDDYVRQVSLEDFGLPFRHKAVWNNRLRSTGGRFFPNDGHLDFNLKVLEEHGEAVFRKIVRHELCHYHLYHSKKGYRHRDKDFKDLLKQVDGLRFVPSSRQATYHYSCRACGTIYSRQRRINQTKYRCGKCLGQLDLNL